MSRRGLTAVGVFWASAVVLGAVRFLLPSLFAVVVILTLGIVIGFAVSAIIYGLFE